MYIVKQEDLIGELKGFPIEIAQRLIECQLEQGNKDDITIFQQNLLICYLHMMILNFLTKMF